MDLANVETPEQLRRAILRGAAALPVNDTLLPLSVLYAAEVFECVAGRFLAFLGYDGVHPTGTLDQYLFKVAGAVETCGDTIAGAIRETHEP